jgi:hypothetical protein
VHDVADMKGVRPYFVFTHHKPIKATMYPGKAKIGRKTAQYAFRFLFQGQPYSKYKNWEKN